MRFWDEVLEPNMVVKNDVRDIVKDEIAHAKLATQHHVDSRFDALENLMTEKVTEPSIRRDRKLDEKTNVVARKLGVKTIFTREEVIEVERFSPFAVKPAVE